MMSPNTYTIFAQLCESFVSEDSSAMSYLQNVPGGPAVIKSLHSNMGLAHDQSYHPIDKILWSDLKDAYNGAWVLIQGANGAGAIKAKNDSYHAIASTGGEIKTFSNSKGGNILDFFKTEGLGKLLKFYVGKSTSTVSQKRAARTQDEPTPTVSKSTLIQKFKPLWAKGIVAAQADIKGHVVNMIKNDAYEKASKKLELLTKLDSALSNIGSDTVPDVISHAMSQAVAMTASHFYPEETGNITRTYRDYTTDYSTGIRHILQDIEDGDGAKVGVILSFFKRSLITG